MLCLKDTAHAEHGRTIQVKYPPNNQEMTTTPSGFGDRSRLCLRTDENSIRNQQNLVTSVGENINEFYRFLKGFYGLADLPTLFHKKVDKTLGQNTSLARRYYYRNLRHIQKFSSALAKLEKEGSKESKKKSKVSNNETKWLEHAISQGGIRPNKEKSDALNKLEQPTHPTPKP